MKKLNIINLILLIGSYSCTSGDSNSLDTVPTQVDISAYININLNQLENYSNQSIPNYITKDNTPQNNPITDEGANLGRVLFYDDNLSATNTVSCASCHVQEHAFGDLAQRSQGINGQTPKQVVGSSPSIGSSS